MKTYAIIPARGGSKGVPGKNIKPLGGFPLIAYSVLAGLHAGYDKVFVSTDDQGIADIAAKFGAEVPFLRPAEMAGDRAPDRAYIQHALDFWRDKGAEPDALAILRPTTPLRDPAILREATALLAARPDATGLRSVHPLPEPPQKMMGLEDGWLTGLFPHDPRPEYYNLPRQAFPAAYQPNGYVDIVTTAHIRATPPDAGIFGPKVLGQPTPVSVEVDTIEEFELLEYQIGRRRPVILDYLQAR
ncbi:MAG: acylneuraminate cytidylyltransferase family protein [Ferrovibrio sp.]|uniref:acylneuraminate cytidylyltransferase family protein n=1 Tax=Ferrovibrio sp. TaxID=1917215 RepID=UPI00391B4ED8